MPNPPPGPIEEPAKPGKETVIAREFKVIKARLLDEARSAVGMLETALRALFESDRDAANEVVRGDDRIDREEVAIEERVFQLMALQAPVAKDFRSLAFALKVNSDIERVADHACSIAKVARKIDAENPPNWPTALVEMGQRVPMMCHALLRAMADEDADSAKLIIQGDKTIDALHKQLFEETVDLLDSGVQPNAVGLLVYRVGRELERVGDLMGNIAEDIVYLATGEIIRHQKRRERQQELPGDRL